MDVESRIRALESWSTTAKDQIAAHIQQLHALAVDVGHLLTKTESLKQSIDSHHDVSTQVGAIQREIDGFNGNVQAITALASNAMTAAGQARATADGLMPRMVAAEGKLPIANIIFGGNGVLVAGYGATVLRTGNGTYDIGLEHDSLSTSFHAQVTMIAGIQKALKDQSTCVVGKFWTPKRLHLETFAIQGGVPVTWDAAEVCLLVWR